MNVLINLSFFLDILVKIEIRDSTRKSNEQRYDERWE